MKKNLLIRATLLTCTILAVEAGAKELSPRPNIVFILADDLGYGDLSHAGGKAATPHCDRLASEASIPENELSLLLCNLSKYNA